MINKIHFTAHQQSRITFWSIHKILKQTLLKNLRLLNVRHLKKSIEKSNTTQTNPEENSFKLRTNHKVHTYKRKTEITYKIRHPFKTLEKSQEIWKAEGLEMCQLTADLLLTAIFSRLSLHDFHQFILIIDLQIKCLCKILQNSEELQQSITPILSLSITITLITLRNYTIRNWASHYVQT